MNYSDLSFVKKNKDGEEMIHDITSVIPNKNNKEEPYVQFTDYSLDEDDEFVYQYGKLIHTKDGFAIDTNLTVFEMDYIEKSLQDEIIQHVNEVIGDCLHE